MGMNSSNFDAMFDKEVDFTKLKLTDLSKFSIEKQEQFKNLVETDPESARAIIEDSQELIPNNFGIKIQNFIKRKREEGIKDERIRRLVKKKFNITVV